MNCLGRLAPILVPDPPATIIAYLFITVKISKETIFYTHLYNTKVAGLIRLISYFQSMNSKYLLAAFLSVFITLPCLGQSKSITPKGSLFIIGGGDRSPALVQSLISTARLGQKDYIVILPMSSAQPDSSYYYIKEDLQPATSAIIANLNFTRNNVTDNRWLDSLKHAKLIFITGGDQSRFMGVVLNTPVVDAIHYAYKNGATIAGTSAGAAVMSKQMITGNQLSADSSSSTFKMIHTNNVELKEGLGLLETVIIDQHFVVRSRYNRLISVLAKFPSYICIGIDEATAIIVQGKKITVAGESQVIVLSDPENLSVNNEIIKTNKVRFSIYTKGDQFRIR
jgi:cyanophycinase